MPSIVVPILRWADQMFYGLRLAEAGAGVVVLSADPTREDIHAAVLACMSDAGGLLESTRRIADAMASERPELLAVHLLQGCLCKRVLEPSELEAMRSRGPRGAKQTMCARHCVPCNKGASAEHAKTA